MKAVVLVDHAGCVARIYETPCGVLTYKKDRKRHDWIAVRADGSKQRFGEDRAAALKAMGPGGRTQLVLS
jgi:hypothetical protein